MLGVNLVAVRIRGDARTNYCSGNYELKVLAIFNFATGSVEGISISASVCI
jgi:hypothetical protein